MRLQDYAPPGTLPYMTLVAMLLTEFRDISSHVELVEKCGLGGLVDVTHDPAIRLMDTAWPLPPGFDERTYMFADPTYGVGVMDAAFRGDDLANARAQLFFRGTFARLKARRFLRETLFLLFREVLGHPAETDRDQRIFNGSGLVGVIRYVPAKLLRGSVSAAITDEQYASWGRRENPQAEVRPSEDLQVFDEAVAMYRRWDKPAQMAVAFMLATMWKAFNAQFDSVEAFREADAAAQVSYLEKLGALEKRLSSDAKLHEAIGVSFLRIYLVACLEGNAEVINHIADQLEPINQLGWFP